MVLQYFAALVLIGHGIGHIIGILASWAGIDVKFKKVPWAFGGGVTMDSAPGKVLVGFWIIPMVLFVGSGIGVFLGEEWWRTLAIIGSISSILTMGTWWRTIIGGAKAGVVLDVAILIVLLVPGMRGVTDFFQVP